MRLRRNVASRAGCTTIVGAVRPFKLSALLVGFFVIFLSAGCAPTRTGATLGELNKKIGGPGGGQARIVVIRDTSTGDLFDSGWQVYLDGAVMGGLKSGTFVYRDRRPGSHKLSFARGGDFSRASTQVFTAASGRTYVFRLEMNEKGKLVQSSAAAAGLAGLLISSVISDAADKRGFFDFVLLEGDTAKQALADIRLAE